MPFSRSNLDKHPLLDMGRWAAIFYEPRVQSFLWCMFQVSFLMGPLVSMLYPPVVACHILATMSARGQGKGRISSPIRRMEVPLKAHHLGMEGQPTGALHVYLLPSL